MRTETWAAVCLWNMKFVSLVTTSQEVAVLPFAGVPDDSRRADCRDEGAQALDREAALRARHLDQNLA